MLRLSVRLDLLKQSCAGLYTRELYVSVVGPWQDCESSDAPKFRTKLRHEVLIFLIAVSEMGHEQLACRGLCCQLSVVEALTSAKGRDRLLLLRLQFLEVFFYFIFRQSSRLHFL